MAPPQRTVGAAHFNPDILFMTWGDDREKRNLPQHDDLRASIVATFDLPKSDKYVYHANTSVTLTQVQEAINHGREAGLHAWYRDEEGNPEPSPPRADISAYTSIFAPNTATSKLLTGLAANAKRGSIRADVAATLQRHRTLPSDMTVPKSKSHINPYYDFWCWSCQNLEWAGPNQRSANVKTSHHILPVFMHHFGCVVPSYESLEVIKQIAGTRTVIDLGSGNGYWTYMLRRLDVSVRAVDNLQSEYRTTWIGDTISKDGEQYLQDENGCRDAVLLLVYPIVSSHFTSKVIDAYKGDTVCLAGTQNRNGYTAFPDRTIDDYMAAEKPEFQKSVQIPLPSFAGKDEALFIFQRNTP